MSLNEPLVSILIPVYGVEKYITQCLKSVANQTYDNLEVIIVNDCTSDKSIDVAKQYIKASSLSGKTIIINHEKNRGLSAARNTAVAAAKGDYLLHLDSDDFLDKDTVKEAVAFAIQQGADAVLFGFTHKYKDFDRVEHISIPKDKIECLNLILQRRLPVCLCGGLYKNTLYDNGVEELEGFDYEEDYVTKPRLLYYANKIVAYDKPFYIYNHLSEGSMSRTFRNKCIEDTIVTIETLRSFFYNVPDSENFVHSMDVAAIKLKANLLRTWCLSVGERNAWNQIQSLFNDIPITKRVGFKDYVSLLIAQLDSPLILKIYNRTGNRIKHFLKKMVK